jgi:hypothetical protein
MRVRSRFWATAMFLSFASAAPLMHSPLRAQNTNPRAITVTVTAFTRGDATPPQIPMSEVVVRQGNKDRPILNWELTNSSNPKLDLVIVIDDSLASSVATRWNELRKFLSDLPAGSRVGAAFASRGSIRLVQQPSEDHSLAAKALDSPAGVTVQNCSIYESVQALIHGWPSRQGRRVLLLISHGIDYEFDAGDNWDDWLRMQKAIEEAQQKNVVVYSIYAKPIMDSSLNVGILERGQNALNFFSTATGGQAYYSLGTETAPTFEPYLQRMQRELAQQYLLTFQAEPVAKPTLVSLHVAAANKAVQLRSQTRVRAPAR